jgi:hypothetical protein
MYVAWATDSIVKWTVFINKHEQNEVAGYVVGGSSAARV